jgi:hypothetical protein
MSINLGIYDVFANIVPGFVYLFVVNEYLKAFGQPNLDLSSTNNLSQFFLLIILAYLVGHVMDYVSYRLWFLRFYSKFEERTAYKQFKERYPELDVTFVPEQSSLLFTIVRQRNHQMAENIDRNKVTCIMLRNASFALILLLPLQLYFAFVNGFSVINFLMALGSIAGSLIALRQAERLDHYFYRLIFENAALEGKNLKSIVLKINQRGIGNNKVTNKESK